MNIYVIAYIKMLKCLALIVTLFWKNKSITAESQIDLNF